MSRHEKKERNTDAKTKNSFINAIPTFRFFYFRSILYIN